MNRVDVFLTPLKPPTKASISLDGVQSSLYFLHVERPEDEDLRHSLEAAKIQEELTGETQPIPGKLLPPTPYANYPASQRPPVPPKSYPHYQPPVAGGQDASQAARHAARGCNLRLTPTGGPQNEMGRPRKPVGARPLPSRRGLDDSAPLGLGSVASSVDEPESHRPWSAPRTKSMPWSPQSADHQGNHKTAYPMGDGERGQKRLDFPPDPHHRPDSSHEAAAVRITLIRRDPSSGSQWNVGTIIIHRVADVGSSLRSVNIELASPGYGRFTQPMKISGQDIAGADAQTAPTWNESSDLLSPTTSATSDVFRRTVSFRPLPAGEKESTGHRRHNSLDIRSSWGTSSSKRARQAYFFISPWQGVCIFSNGVDGRTLRCRHSLSPAGLHGSGTPVDVAEVRFNLPWSALRSRDSPHKQGNEESDSSQTSPMLHSTGAFGKDRWRRSLQHFGHKSLTQRSPQEQAPPTSTLDSSYSSADEADEHGRVNLVDLGREKAGGGFKGKSAKLGKLIIQDEGLKMCDLVVAACMGVWWQHYDDQA